LTTGRIAGGFFIGKLNVTLLLRPISTPDDSILGNPDGKATGNGARWRTGKFDVIPPQKFKSAPYQWGIWTHLIHSSLGPLEFTSQTASRWVQPFLQGSRLLYADRQTDRQTTLLPL